MTYKAYSGIGSRDTPEPVLNAMRRVGGYLHSQGWTLRSGGAGGADLAFEHGVNRQLDQMVSHTNSKEIYLPWPGFLGSTSSLHPDKYPFTDEEIGIAAHFHPAWDRCSPAAQKMHTRNVRQIVGLREILGGEQIASKFIVCWTDAGRMKGGTSQALRIAEHLNIPIINFGLAIDDADLTAMLHRVDNLQKDLS